VLGYTSNSEINKNKFSLFHDSYLTYSEM